MSDDVFVGAVGKPLGLHGDVYVHSDPDVAHDFAPGTTYRLADGRTLTVAATRIHANRRVVRFAEASDRSAAEQLRGAVLHIARDAVQLDDDAFWASDLLGREVRDPDGAIVGVVESLLDGPAHDYLIIARPDGGEAMIPAVADLVEITAEAIVVRAIPGLLDDDALE